MGDVEEGEDIPLAGGKGRKCFFSIFLGDVRPPMRHGAITITATTTGTCTIHWTELALEIERT